ncbi:hypothetical protein [Flavobacterium granuli]|uniref:Uncharacterized protein n=1 Tax=Flavobacterium granuli TaxID=280093 RepID=A0ABU1S0G3_9FLAO|nr:hypothetical protein [Flavobacterium granuli]MDR6844518.1 hypothetical protein [Flavobacterium granuli]
MKNRLGMKAFIERIDNSPSKTLLGYIEEQNAILNVMPHIMGIPLGFEQNRLPELVMNQKGESVALAEVDRKDHFTDAISYIPEGYVERANWLDVYNELSGMNRKKTIVFNQNEKL